MPRTKLCYNARVLDIVQFARWRRTWLIAACGTLCMAGAGMARYYMLHDWRWLLVAVPTALAAAWHKNTLTVLSIFLLCFGAGWWRGTVAAQELRPYSTLALQKVTIEGRATEDAVYGKQSQLTFGMDHLHVLSPQASVLPGQISVAGFGVSAVMRGDTVRVAGKLYPTRGNNLASISFAQLQVTERDRSPINGLRRRFTAGLETALPEPEASFGLGLLIGQRSTLPADIAETLLVVGLTHIIAVSGYNLTILVDAARRVLGGRSKYQLAVACLLLIAGFLLLAGGSPSIVRASIISVLSMWAWYYGRAIKPAVLLLTAGAASVLLYPPYVWGNVSWYLSFLAFCGVIIVAPLVTRRLYGLERQPKIIMQMVIESLCAELMTLPYVLYIFGQMSLVGLLGNVLVAVFVPLAMLLCAVAGLMGMAAPLLAGWVSWPARWLLTYMLDMTQLLSRIPHAFAENIGFSLLMLLAWYGIVAAGLLMVHYKNERKYATITEKIGTRTEGV